MDKHLQQTFDIRYLKIGKMANAAVLKIGSSGPIKRFSTLPKGYTIHPLGTSTTSSAPAVPLQAPVRQKK